MATAAKSLNNEYKDPKLVQKLGKKASAMRVPSLALGLPTVDEDVIGCGGFPDGRIVEIYGPASAGKTTLTLAIIAAAQAQGDIAAFVDAEHALMLSHAKSMGVNIEDLIISQPDYGEQALEVVRALTETGAVRVIVVDSVSALVPKAELDGDMGDSHMGLQARLMSQAMRKLAGIASKTGTLIVFINQVREKIGVMYGNPEVTTGGNALKFYASLRLEVRRLSKSDGGELLNDAKQHVGHRMRVKDVKNKVGMPYRETVVDLIYGEGFDKKADTIEFLLGTGDILVGDKTKDNEGNGVSKGFLGFEGEQYRRNELTDSPVWDKVVLAAKKVIDDRIAASKTA